MARHVVAPAEELPAGARKLVEIGGRRIAIFNVGGALYAILDRCPHQGGSLYRGALTGLVESSEPGEYRYSRPGEIVRCPWHGWEYDLATGQSWCDPRRMRVKTYEVEIESGGDLVKGPYVAETFPVRLEGDYVVVEA